MSRNYTTGNGHLKKSCQENRISIIVSDGVEITSELNILKLNNLKIMKILICILLILTVW